MIQHTSIPPTCYNAFYTESNLIPSTNLCIIQITLHTTITSNSRPSRKKSAHCTNTDREKIVALTNNYLEKKQKIYKAKKFLPRQTKALHSTIFPLDRGKTMTISKTIAARELREWRSNSKNTETKSKKNTESASRTNERSSNIRSGPTPTEKPDMSKRPLETSTIPLIDPSEKIEIDSEGTEENAQESNMVIEHSKTPMEDKTSRANEKMLAIHKPSHNYDKTTISNNNIIGATYTASESSNTTLPKSPSELSDSNIPIEKSDQSIPNKKQKTYLSLLQSTNPVTKSPSITGQYSTSQNVLRNRRHTKAFLKIKLTVSSNKDASKKMQSLLKRMFKAIKEG